MPGSNPARSSKCQTDTGKKYEIISVAAVMLQDGILPLRRSPPFCILPDRMLYFTGQEKHSKDRWSQIRKGRHAEFETHPEL
jgi:hypothetical protein